MSTHKQQIGAGWEPRTSGGDGKVTAREELSVISNLPDLLNNTKNKRFSSVISNYSYLLDNAEKVTE